MDLQLAGKRAFVSGASSGIGAAVAETLAAEGAGVVVSYGANQEGAEDVARRVKATGSPAWLCPLDMRDGESVKDAVETVRASAAPIDIAVLCAGANSIHPLDELDPEEWERIVDINLNGTYRVLHAVRPLIPKGGSVVLVSSVAGYTGAPHHAHYAAAKAGLMTLAKSGARAWAPDIRVNCVAPGITATPMGEQTIASLPPDYAEKNLLTSRYATPEEIAALIVFVASPLAGFITGATFDANGGRYLR